MANLNKHFIIQDHILDVGSQALGLLLFTQKVNTRLSFNPSA